MDKVKSSLVSWPALVLALLFLATGCSLPWAKKVPVIQPPVPKTEKPATSTDVSTQLAAQSKIKKFATKEELVAFLEANQNQSYNGFGGGRMARGMMLEAATDSFAGGMTKTLAAPAANTAAVAQESGATGDFSKTNVQVEGVDEADIVKTDGQYIYALNRQEIVIALAYPVAEAKISSRLSFKGQPQELYISGSKLVVFGQSYGNEIMAKQAVDCSGKADCIAPDMPVMQGQFTFIEVYDVSDKSKPKLERNLALEGSYVNSRLIGDYVYLLTSKQSYDFSPEPLPLVIRQGKAALMEMPPVYYFDMPYQSFNFTAVSAINIKDSTAKEKSEIYLLSGTQNLFVSQNNIYITYTKYLDENQLRMEATREILSPRLAAADKERIAKIDAADEQILSSAEKQAKIFSIIARYLMKMSQADQQKIEEAIKETIKQKYADISKELEKTVVHKIAIAEDKIEYKTVAEVPGMVLNQFSMDEQDGYFRIATTKNRSWSNLVEQNENESYSNMYVLDKDMKQVGALENLAKGERIYSVRFLGKRAYMVTFKQTDPLFVIDLSVPAAPKVLGELKIPGFSNYLHPYDENTLIGFGKDTSENQFGGVIAGGLKLSLFDVSQVDKPVELDHYTMGDRGSDSIALSDHRAFLFSRDKNLLVVPVSLYQSSNKMEWGKFVFGGAAVFSIDDKKFVLRGKIDHSDNGQPGGNYYLDGYSYYDNNVLRSLYIKDTLFTYSARYLKANKLSDLAELKKIGFRSEVPVSEASSTEAVALPDDDGLPLVRPVTGQGSEPMFRGKQIK
ncbi:hypothetical protein HGA34_03930 [Candidatus Falkowbacteria bacterium]|nr:hypothetical protein [Candidatus Falkowbacteria bacterium]